MTVDDSLFLENIKILRADIAGVKTSVEELGTRLTRLEIKVAGQRREMAIDSETIAHQQIAIDQVNVRIQRLEVRSNLVGSETGPDDYSAE